ncbi:hypothetical protein EAH79_00245 [Sphingomonas koreensis]|nr:hypothetical protein EAH79_00245 [Sphingomonas koreensis]
MAAQLNAATVIAADTKSALSATDDALLHHTQLFASVLQASKTMSVPICTSQKLYQALHKSAGALVDSRGSFQQSIALLHSVAREQGFADMLEGCPGGGPMGQAGTTPGSSFETTSAVA